MYYYDLFMQGPGVFIPVLLLSLLITLLGYGAFPLIFSRVRKKQITKKKFTLLCYGVNLLVMITFIAFGSKSSGAPYMLWTWIFSSAGIRRLEKRGKFGSSFINNDLSNEEIIISDDDIVENDDNIIENVSNVNAGVDVKVVADNDVDNLHTDNKTSKEKVLFCKLCGSKIDSETRKCNGCGKQYFKGIKLNKFLTTALILSVVILISVILNIVQFVKIDSLNYSTKMLRYEISKLEKENYETVITFLDYGDYAVAVNDNSQKYHTRVCGDFDESSFRLYSITAAEESGYYACSTCKERKASEFLRKKAAQQMLKKLDKWYRLTILDER